MSKKLSNDHSFSVFKTVLSPSFATKNNWQHCFLNAKTFYSQLTRKNHEALIGLETLKIVGNIKANFENTA